MGLTGSSHTYLIHQLSCILEMPIDRTIRNILEIWLRPFKYLFILILEKREYGYLRAGCDYLKNETCHLSYHTTEIIYSWRRTSNYWTLCLLRQWKVYPHGYEPHNTYFIEQISTRSICHIRQKHKSVPSLFLYIISVILFYSMWTWRHFNSWIWNNFPVVN